MAIGDTAPGVGVIGVAAVVFGSGVLTIALASRTEVDDGFVSVNALSREVVLFSDVSLAVLVVGVSDAVGVVKPVFVFCAEVFVFLAPWASRVSDGVGVGVSGIAIDIWVPDELVELVPTALVSFAPVASALLCFPLSLPVVLSDGDETC
ncbi:MAG TPA: hypothetical protein VFB19_07865 [Mycobacterium sp.]|nr:hypothetical protein [Mycobacterium sp.]